MYLLCAATEFELAPLRTALASHRACHWLVTGVGPVEAAFSLTRFLVSRREIDAVINVGIAGAYPDQGAGMLDLCLARREVLADFGICLEASIAPLPGESMEIHREFDLDSPLLERAHALLAGHGRAVLTGLFLTVNCVSAWAGRGRMLGTQWGALCENMEGAALARVCSAYTLPFLELRAISNMVEERDRSRWRLEEACSRASEAAALLVPGLFSGEQG